MDLVLDDDDTAAVVLWTINSSADCSAMLST